MTGLRFKLLLGFGGLLIVLGTVSVLANMVLRDYSRTNDRMLREDLASIAATEQIRAALLGIDRELLAAVRGREPSRDAIRPHLEAFESALVRQQSAATLPREPEATAAVAADWANYKAAIGHFLAATNGSDRARLYEQEVIPADFAIRGSTASIAEANAQSIREVESIADASGHRARMLMHALTACGAGVAALFALMIGRLILRPVRQLTQSVHQIEQGNLEMTVPVNSRDELGKLAIAFNAMAAQLRVFRQIDQEKLIRSQRATQLAIDSLPDGVVLVSEAGDIELANETAKRVFGLQPGERVADLTTAAGRCVADLHLRVGREGRLPEIGGYAGALRVRTGTTDANEPSGGNPQDTTRDRFFLPRAVPVLDEHRRVIGTTVVLADVTDYRRLDEMKNSLLSLVSHELKTPLTSMRMILPLLLEGKVGGLSPRQKDLLVATRDDADRLHLIVENLLDMGRLESGKALMEVRPVQPTDLVARAVEAFHQAYADQQIKLEFVGEPGDNASTTPVRADRTRIGHVLANLLGNALRYTKAGGRVRVGLRTVADRIEFSVADNGAGIPRQHLPRVFEKFFRVPGQPGETGSGLGLAIVKDIVEAHGGHVSVESTEGKGTTFRFSLPIADASPAPTTETVSTKEQIG